MKTAVLLLRAHASRAAARTCAERLSDVSTRGVLVAIADAHACPAAATDALGGKGVEFLVVVAFGVEDGHEVAHECAKALGVDDLNIETLSDDALPLLQRIEEDAPRLVRGALAAAQDARNIAPVHRRIGPGILGKRLSRRALFLGLLQQTTTWVPTMDAARCKAGKGCSLCVTACPTSAWTTPRGISAKLAPGRCATCGLCVAACPAGAISFLPLDASAFASRVRALLGPDAPGAITLVLGSPTALEDAGHDGPPCARVLPIVVPCAGALPPSFLLHALRAGARGVVLLPCPPGSPCGAARCAARVTTTVDSANAVLRVVGRSTASIQAAPDPAGLRGALSRVEQQPRALPPPSTPPRGLGREARAIMMEAEGHHDITDVAGIPCGLPILAPGACTLCGLCASACPTGALRVENDQRGTRLEGRHADCCACSLCVKSCPEGAIGLSRGLHTAHLREETTVLASATRASCQRCGDALLPQPLRDHVKARITPAMATRTWLDLCPSCRLLGETSTKGGATP